MSSPSASSVDKLGIAEASRVRIAIIGAGHAGGSAAAFLRQFGHQGPLMLIGTEPHLPYQRPPLSKAYLKGAATADSLLLRPTAYYAERDVAMVIGTTVDRVDAASRTVLTDDGQSFHYDALILATGSTARRLSVAGAELDGVHHLRDIADADALRDMLAPGKRLAIIGGGYVGLEAAASALLLGASAVSSSAKPDCWRASPRRRWPSSSPIITARGGWRSSPVPMSSGWRARPGTSTP